MVKHRRVAHGQAVDAVHAQETVDDARISSVSAGDGRRAHAAHPAMAVRYVKGLGAQPEVEQGVVGDDLGHRVGQRQAVPIGRRCHGVDEACDAAGQRAHGTHVGRVRVEAQPGAWQHRRVGRGCFDAATARRGIEEPRRQADDGVAGHRRAGTGPRARRVIE